MKTEIWKVHPEYARIEVSTLGRVRTLDKMVWNGSVTYFKKGRVLKQHLNIGGYLKIGFYVNGKRVDKYVHRLVAQTFIPNPHGFPMVNHKNCNRADNRVSNLEWCNASYNIQYREKFGESLGHPVFAVNLTTLKVYRFRSQREAGRMLGIKQANINGVIKGKYKQIHGYYFVNDDGHALDIVKSKLHDIGKTGLILA